MDLQVADFEALPRLVVAITPRTYNPEHLTTKQCRDLVSASQVRSRGWVLPYINNDNVTTGPKGTYVAGQVKFGGFALHREQWRMYRSGQFVFRMLPWEVPDDELQKRMRENSRGWDSRQDVDKIPGFLSFVSMILSVSEVHMFAARLAQVALFETDVEINVGYRGVLGWTLGSNEVGVHLYKHYAAHNERVEHVSRHAIDQLIAEPLKAAVRSVLALFEQFGWNDAAIGTVEGWQRQYIK